MAKARADRSARAGVASPSLAPRLGAEVIQERGAVRYRILETRSLLNRCTSPRVPFAWTVNPYRGCAMGCRYCYATYTHEFLGRSRPEDFHSAVWVKRGGETETARRLAAVVRRGERIALGTATDPYQPGEAQEGVTRRFLEQVARHRGVRLGITTKGALVLRDLELLLRIHERSELRVSVSLISTDGELLRRIEPLAPPPAVRLEVLRRLSAAGLEVSLSVAPVLPGLSDDEAGLTLLFARAREAGVRRYSARLLFLRSPARERFLTFLEQEFPRYAEAYRRAYEARAFLQGRYAEQTLARVARLAERHGLARVAFGGRRKPQLPLFPDP